MHLQSIQCNKQSQWEHLLHVDQNLSSDEFIHCVPCVPTCDRVVIGSLGSRTGAREAELCLRLRLASWMSTDTSIGIPRSLSRIFSCGTTTSHAALRNHPQRTVLRRERRHFSRESDYLYGKFTCYTLFCPFAVHGDGPFGFIDFVRGGGPNEGPPVNETIPRKVSVRHQGVHHRCMKQKYKQ